MLPLVGPVDALRFERFGQAPASLLSHAPYHDLAIHDFDLLRFFGFAPAFEDRRDPRPLQATRTGRARGGVAGAA
ncbi:MAG: hypothetical protein ACXVUE_12275 [Solirubrobacteraceae bacterium]